MVAVKNPILVWHLAAMAMAAIALLSLRHEFTETAATRLRWAVGPALAVAVAAVLLFVSPGKRSELWTVAILAGLAAGIARGTALRADTDFERRLVRIHRAWDGIAAAALLLVLALARFVTSDVMVRQSGKFGVLGAAAAFLAAFLAARVLALHWYTAPRSTHLDMVRGQKPPGD